MDYKRNEYIILFDNDYNSGLFRGLYKALIEFSLKTDVLVQKDIDELVEDGFLEKLEYNTMDICV